MRLTFTAAIAAATLVSCGSPSAEGREASAVERLVAALEQRVPLPDASRTLGGYDRYYAVSEDRIEGLYLSSDRRLGRVHLVDRDRFPEAKGEGCAVVRVTYNRADDRFDQILCNVAQLAELQLLPATSPRGSVQEERGAEIHRPPIEPTPASGGERG